MFRAFGKRVHRVVFSATMKGRGQKAAELEFKPQTCNGMKACAGDRMCMNACAGQFQGLFSGEPVKAEVHWWPLPRS